ncbi:MAG: hypothetical protein ACP5QT_06230 [Brevinematia bacterium]
MNISGDLILLIIVISGVAMLQFYRGRKINLAIMKSLANGFEKSLDIKDKLYTWIGGYSGFKADYEMKDKTIRKIELTLTLLPRQSFFWLPFSFLLRRGDRLYIVIKPEIKMIRDVHIIKRFFYPFGAGIKERKALKKDSYERKFYSLYEEEEDVKNLMKIVESSIDVKRLRHIAIVKETNVLYCLIKPDPLKTPAELKKLVENFKENVRCFM